MTQFIGLYVVNTYATQAVVNGNVTNVTGKTLPYGMGFQDQQGQVPDLQSIIISFVFSFVIAVSLVFLLIKINAKLILKTWFFIVVVIALGISITAFLPSVSYAAWIGLGIGALLAFLKFYRRGFLTHNLTELLIYPGIAAVFVPVIGIWGIVILLVIISIYDMWAVWKSKIMQKMAKYQMDKLNIFGGFFIPYASKKVKEKIKLYKAKGKNIKKMKFKVNVAILGGGDIIFPIIASGVVLKIWGLVPAAMITFGAFLGLTGLLFFSEKKKFYPAMPFITIGIFLALAVDYLIFVI
jgi:presenilin-like A22 family membrane protease